MRNYARSLVPPLIVGYLFPDLYPTRIAG